MSEPTLIDHEVRIQLLEKNIMDADDKSKSHQDTLKSQFVWIIGTVFTSIAGLILHAIKLI